MLTGRRHLNGDASDAALGLASTDYEGTGYVGTKAQVKSAREVEMTDAYRRRLLCRRAIAQLSRLGWTKPEIAVVVGYTEQHVRALARSNRQLAEAAGRV
jgi:hypothetical protein